MKLWSILLVTISIFGICHVEPYELSFVDWPTPAPPTSTTPPVSSTKPPPAEQFNSLTDILDLIPIEVWLVVLFLESAFVGAFGAYCYWKVQQWRDEKMAREKAWERRLARVSEVSASKNRNAGGVDPAKRPRESAKWLKHVKEVTLKRGGVELLPMEDVIVKNKEKFKKPQNELRENEVWVERQTGPDIDKDSDPKTENALDEQDYQLEDGWHGKSALNITRKEFKKLFTKMSYSPSMCSIIPGKERDPSKTVIANWFEWCQPEFEIPIELTAMSAGNPKLCRDPKVQAWDSTSYLVDDTHFIHASTVTAPGKEYIGKAIICQAPFDDKEKGHPDTRESFWRMVWDTRATYVVMCCQIMENGVQKCGRYFPDETGATENYGFAEVQLLEKHEMLNGHLLTRKIELTSGTWKHSDDDPPIRTITHFQFLKWKEGEGLEGEMSMDAFNYVNHRTRNNLDPIIVHSSLGTGRACAFVGAEYMFQMINTKKCGTARFFQVDFRTKRLGALQNGKQLFWVQNMAFELLIKKLKMHHLKFEMEEQWNFLKNYSNKETDKAARDTLAITDQQMCGQTVSFKGVPGQKVRILMRSINAEQEMLEEQKTQEATDKSVKQRKVGNAKKTGGH
ncbi:Tyrosine-protein phosphatase domain-containing protein [Caenorhabditis elegans]|uniref:Tyrosine-protein phosphatase domain-containing protein n=1 Tax=Caenorhabditis elegans TaxID=6239 RepID=Q95XL1_CAEEL|nr:Tyrosine-protein phosphatase domain-containing protein [Caenorhabditis elegans]CCD73851.2 Tyrosine-protein phosphatase domain-containing protein [Caenorhabditis elegans]